MRKFFWLCLFLGGYIWMVTTGNEALVLERCKVVYNLIGNWLKDADIDFQVKKNHKVSDHKRERHKRWD